MEKVGRKAPPSLNSLPTADSQSTTKDPPTPYTSRFPSVTPLRRRLGNPSEAVLAYNKFSMREPYLLDVKATDPSSSRELVKVLKTDKRAFYYYKQRRLFRKYRYEFGRKGSPCDLDRELPVKKQSPQPSHSPCPSSLTPQANRQLTPIFGSRKLSKGSLITSFRKIISKCELEETVKAGKSHKLTLSELKKVRREHVMTKEILDQVIDCEPDMLNPYYENQLNSMRGFHEDIQKFAEEHRQKARHTARETAKFAQLLRNNKNLLL